MFATRGQVRRPTADRVRRPRRRTGPYGFRGGMGPRAVRQCGAPSRGSRDRLPTLADWPRRRALRRSEPRQSSIGCARSSPGQDYTQHHRPTQVQTVRSTVWRLQGLPEPLRSSASPRSTPRWPRAASAACRRREASRLRSEAERAKLTEAPARARARRTRGRRRRASHDEAFRSSLGHPPVCCWTPGRLVRLSRAPGKVTETTRPAQPRGRWNFGRRLPNKGRTTGEAAEALSRKDSGLRGRRARGRSRAPSRAGSRGCRSRSGS